MWIHQEVSLIHRKNASIWTKGPYQQTTQTQTLTLYTKTNFKSISVKKPLLKSPIPIYRWSQRFIIGGGPVCRDPRRGAGGGLAGSVHGGCDAWPWDGQCIEHCPIIYRALSATHTPCRSYPYWSVICWAEAWTESLRRRGSLKRVHLSFLC